MGTWTNIDNAEGGESVRDKINAAFAYLFGWVADPPEGEDQSQWEAQGANDIKPKDDKGVVAPNLNVADDFIVPPAGDIVLSRNTTIAVGDLKVTDLAATADPVPVLVDNTGKLITELPVGGINTITINIYSTVTGAPLSGYLQFYNLPGYGDPIQFSGLPSVFIENLPNIAANVRFRVDEVNGDYKPYFGSLGAISGSEFYEVNMESIIGIQPGDVVEGRGTVKVSEGVATSADRANPVLLVARDENHTVTLPDAELNNTVEISARKTVAGEALTLFSNEMIVLDEQEGNVLTTTVKGAWARVKSAKDGLVWKWYVVQDSGDWEVDTI